MRTSFQPLMSVAATLRRHKPLLLNWFRARGKFSAGCVEGMSGKAKLTMKKAYGFKSYNVAEVALLHTLGTLPTHKSPTDFCEETPLKATEEQRTGDSSKG